MIRGLLKVVYLNKIHFKYFVILYLCFCFRALHELQVKEALSNAISNEQKFVVHYVGENAKLGKLTDLCPNLPILLFAYNKGHLTARCSVPEVTVLPDFYEDYLKLKQLKSTPSL
jgi:hypothetical protein